MSFTSHQKEIYEKSFEQNSTSSTVIDYSKKIQMDNILGTNMNKINKNRQIVTQSLVSDVSTQGERHYQIDGEDSEDSFRDSKIKLKNSRVANKPLTQRFVKKSGKTQLCRMTVSLRHGKSNKICKSKKEYKKRHFPKFGRKNEFLKPSVKIQSSSQKRNGTSSKGKRGTFGGKAKGKPAHEEIQDKWESDEESDNMCYYRVSLGYFQQFKDNSGASTSYQCENNDCLSETASVNPFEKAQSTKSEELELLELRRWGRNSLVSADNLPGKMEKMNLKESSKI